MGNIGADKSMIEFIVYDDQKEFCQKTEKAIKKAIEEKSITYSIKTFNSYTKEFEDTINQNMTSKIYILDIDVPNSISGIDVARRIRKKDWNSIIMMVTSHVELGYEALKAQIMLLDFICKQNDCTNTLIKTLKKAVNKVNDKKVMVFECNGITNRVYTDDILYVKRDSIDRKCIIQTTYNQIPVSKNLSEFIEELDSRFYLSHRSCLINTEKIKSVDWKNNIIYFDNNDSTDYLAREKRKGLKEYVGSH